MKTTFTYVGIRVKDLRESIDVYTNLLGMTLVKRHAIAETGGEIAELQSGDAAFILELNHYGAASPTTPTTWSVRGWITSPSRSTTSTRLREAARRGLPYTLEVATERSRWAYIEDPNGIWIELFTR